MEKNTKKERIKKITHLYYSRQDVQKEICDFSQNREVVPRYFEGFGKRPDSIQYPNDVFELAKKGATSFHCSEEIWKEPLELSTGLSKDKLNELRTGWDLVIDIDCRWFDYSKKAARAIVNVLKEYNVRNIGIKFSGSKGMHILVPWKAFPKVIGGKETKDLFPEVPRKIVAFLRFKAEKEMKKILPNDFYSQFKDIKISRGIKCNNCGEIAEEFYLKNLFCHKCKREELKKIKTEEERKKEYKCPECNIPFEFNESKSKKIYECKGCDITSQTNPDNFSKTIEIDLFELMGLDLVLVSPRHLFRTPYSLHEKTALASVVLDVKELEDFQPPDANPLRTKVKKFMPDSIEGEASKLLIEALDWYKENNPEEDKERKSFALAQQIKIEKISEKNFPPSIREILQGLEDGKKRALFILVNFFHSIGLNKEEAEQKIFEWNKKNKVPLNEGYIKTQISWSYKKSPVLPPNFDKDYYRGIGINPSSEEINYKNPVNYFVKKSFSEQKQDKRNSKKKKTENKRKIKRQ